MAKCEDIQMELDAFLSEEVQEEQKKEIQSHLDECPTCTKELQKLTKLSEVLHTWKEIEPSPKMFDAVKSRMKSPSWTWSEIFSYAFSRKFAFRLIQAAVIVVLTLLINSWLHKPLPIESEKQAAINLYLQEHQSAVVQTVSSELLSQPAAHMIIGQDDILYFEYIEDHPITYRSGMIVKGPRAKQEIRVAKAPEISRGRIIDQSEVQGQVDYIPIIPEHLPTGYVLSSIRLIDETNCIHLLYIKGLDTISFFQQPSLSQNGLSAQDFRDYAVYCSQDPEADLKIKGRGTILAWSDRTLSYVLIGDADLSELMDMVNVINTTKNNK